MVTLRVFPFIGAFIAVAAVVLSIVSLSTTYWSVGLGSAHSGIWQTCTPKGCTKTEGGRPAVFALTAVVAMGVAALLAIFSGLTRNKSDASNNMARLCGVLSVVLLFSSGVLIAASIYAYFAAKLTTGYSFTIMTLAQFSSFLGAMFIAHWMGHSFNVVN